jgi:hypothetical protein
LDDKVDVIIFCLTLVKLRLPRSDVANEGNVQLAASSATAPGKDERSFRPPQSNHVFWLWER